MPYKDHQEQLAAKARYRARYRERLRSYANEYAAKRRAKKAVDPEVRRKRAVHAAKLAMWVATRQERERLRKRRQYERNREAINARARAKREVQRAKEGRLMRRKHLGREEQRQVRRVHKRNRAMRKRGMGGRLTPGIIKRLLWLQKRRCAACQQRLMKYHLDHIEPLARGGTHTDDNVQLLCVSCNLNKAARSPLAFMRIRGNLL